MGWELSDQEDQLAVEDDRLDLLEGVQAEGTIVCALTGTQYKDTAYEQTLQSLIEQLHREYDVALEDMERDFRVALEIEDSTLIGCRWVFALRDGLLNRIVRITARSSKSGPRQ